MKAGDLFVGIVDFFAALLPGTLVTLVVLSTMESTPALPPVIASSSEATALAFIATAFLVGSLINAIGSLVLDGMYDALFKPGKGSRSTRERHPDEEAPPLPNGHEDPWPLIAAVRDGMDVLRVPKNVRPTGDHYSWVRAYLQIAVPRAFAEVERLEAEQKLFRTTTVGATLIAPLLAVRATLGDGGFDATDLLAPLAALAVAKIAYDRFVDRRRKTVRFAYTYFVLRAAPAACAEPLTRVAAAKDDDE